ncbi:hypothetical protein L1Q77_25325, partial [Klebsiella pneumoniae]
MRQKPGGSYYATKPKQKFKITNWPTYNKALINRGSITFWLDDEA